MLDTIRTVKNIPIAPQTASFRFLLFTKLDNIWILPNINVYIIAHLTELFEKYAGVKISIVNMIAKNIIIYLSAIRKTKSWSL